MSSTLTGQVVEEGGAGVGGCRVDAVFLERVTVSIPRRGFERLPRDRVVTGDRVDSRGNTDDRDRTVLMTVDDAPLDTEMQRTGRATATTNGKGSFALTLPNVESIDFPIGLAVAGPSGVHLANAIANIEDVDSGVIITVVPPPRVDVPAVAEPIKTTQRINGLVVDTAGRRQAANLQVILYGVTEGGSAASALGVATTDGRGHFVTEWPSTVFDSASARVGAVEDLVPIPLEDGRLPLRVLLVVDLPDPSTAESDCHCTDIAVPRTPDPTDLATSSDYSTDLGVGGCIRFKVPNRSIEEFDFYNVVRTTEPDIRGVTVGGTPTAAAPGPEKRLRASEALLRSLARRGDSMDPAYLEHLLERAGVDVAALREQFGGELTIEAVQELLQLELLDELIGTTTTTRAPGRATLDSANPVDWDTSPTFYEAATIAHDHLLDVKQVWYADGYSLGDLLYSLPLAPGQKKLVAVIDWERKETAIREDETLASDSVFARLARERDLSEVVSGALSESIRGGSRSTTAGVGAGTGAAGNGSYYGMNFGALLGVSGGYGEGNSAAWQDSARTIGSSSLQSLRDLTLQSASSVRGQRTSVITTASQGEASSPSPACSSTRSSRPSKRNSGIGLSRPATSCSAS